MYEERLNFRFSQQTRGAKAMMTSQVCTCIVILLLTTHRSICLPVPSDKGVTQQGKEPVPVDAGKDEKYVSEIPVTSEPHRERRELEEDMEAAYPGPEFSPDTLDAMEKMNPLTIGNQVSRMLRKGYQKNHIASKHPFSHVQIMEEQAKANYGEEPERQPMEGKHEPQDRVDERQPMYKHEPQDGAEERQSMYGKPEPQGRKEELQSTNSKHDAQVRVEGRQPMYGKHEPQGRVEERQPMDSKNEPQDRMDKTGNGDYGYSVILMAGDPVKIPLKFNGKKPLQGKKIAAAPDEGEAREGYGANDVSTGGRGDEKMQAKEPFLGKEFRVPKQFCVSPEFPVYDADINFVPDPFHGILNDNYWRERNRDQHVSAWPVADPMQWGDWEDPHVMQVRSSDVSSDGNDMSDPSSCGTWKHNETKSDVPEAQR